MKKDKKSNKNGRFNLSRIDRICLFAGIIIIVFGLIERMDRKDEKRTSDEKQLFDRTIHPEDSVDIETSGAEESVIENSEIHD